MVIGTMLRFRLLAVPLVGLALFGVASAANNQDAAITSAALAPYRDELLRDAPALCSDLARPPITIEPGAPQGASCERAVQSIFAATAPSSLPRDLVSSLRASVSRLRIDGHRATGIVSLSASGSTTDHGITTETLVWVGRYQLSLEQIAGRWLVSSQARLAAIDDCQLKSQGDCHPGVKDLLFVLGVSPLPTPGESIPTPAAVRRASGRERREFAAGRTVFAQSGCLACHKIGDDGNPGPGQNLTHVGARLSSRQIEHVLLSPGAPMPSFKKLPSKQLHDLIRFLCLMR
jgi:Cytochrome C oxidase, cbb3-type, subunit III